MCTSFTRVAILRCVMEMNDTPNVDLARYREEGYCVCRRVVSATQVERYLHSLDAMIESLEPGRRLESLVEPHIHAADWPSWLELCRDPGLLEVAGKALCADELLLLSTHLLVKPPHDGLAVAWHQDNTYWPGVNGTGVCTLWLALDDTDIENSCMCVIPRTHVGYPAQEMMPTDGRDLLGVTVAVTPEMEAAAVALELRAGDASVHDSFVIHGSEPNLSSRRRAGLTLRYANAGTVAIDLERHGKPVYYVAGNGESCRDGMRNISAGRWLPTDPGEHRSRRFQRNYDGSESGGRE